MSLPIYEATTACRSHFERLRGSKWHNGDVKLVAWLQRQSIEFNLWSHCSGALAKGRYSLDGKLCLRKPLQSTISNLLWILDSLLADESQLAHRLQSQARQDVEETLADIVTLTAKARNALPFFGIWNPDESAMNMDISLLPPMRENMEADDSEEELGQKPDFDFYDDNRQALPRRRTASLLTQQDFLIAPSQSQQISDRLRRADAKRRSRFELARKRWEQRGRPQPAEIPTTWPPRSQLMLPAVPVVSASSSSFVCPYCYDLLPAYFAEAHAWREHIISDLAPYTCIIPDCLQPSRLYARKEEWMDHMLNDPHGDTESWRHIQRWRCPMCEEHLDDSPSCVGHLEHEHRSELRKAGITASMAVQFCPEPMLEMEIVATCPVCPLNRELGETNRYTNYRPKGSPLYQPQGQDVDEDESDEMTREELVGHVASCLEVWALKAIKSPDPAAMESSLDDCPALSESVVLPLVTPGTQVDAPLPQLPVPDLPTAQPEYFISGLLDILDMVTWPTSYASLTNASILRYVQEYNPNELLGIGFPAPDAHQWIARETIRGLVDGVPSPRRQIATTYKGNVSPPISDDHIQSSPSIKYDQRSGLSMYPQSSAPIKYDLRQLDLIRFNQQSGMAFLALVC